MLKMFRHSFFIRTLSINNSGSLNILAKLVKSVLHFLNNNKKESNKIAYRKISKISTGAYIFQTPFLRGLFLEVLIFGGPYTWRGLFS